MIYRTEQNQTKKSNKTTEALSPDLSKLIKLNVYVSEKDYPTFRDVLTEFQKNTTSKFTWDTIDKKNQIDSSFKNENRISVTPKLLDTDQQISNTITTLLKEYFDICLQTNKKPAKVDFLNHFCYTKGYYIKYSSMRLSIVFKDIWSNEYASYFKAWRNKNF